MKINKEELFKMLASSADLDEDQRGVLKDSNIPALEDLKNLYSGNLNLVNHPAHYNHGEKEVIDIIEDWELCFHCGNAIKYIFRHKHKKNPIQDIEKAIWYLKRYLGNLKDE